MNEERLLVSCLVHTGIYDIYACVRVSVSDYVEIKCENVIRELSSTF